MKCEKNKQFCLRQKIIEKLKKKINEKRLSLRKKWKRDHVVFFSYREKFTEQKLKYYEVSLRCFMLI